MTKRVVAYIRVSTEEQAEHGYSLDGQQQVLTDFAKGHDLQIVECFVESQSAAAPGRPEFERMTRLLAADKSIRAVLCYKIDRLARNMTDYACLVEKLGLEIISATEMLPSNATGQLMGNVQAAFSTYFSRQLSERIQLAMETKAKKGLWPSVAPTGYVNLGKGQGIAPDSTRADLVRKLFEVYASTDLSVEGLTTWARDHGLRTRRGGAPKRSAIHAMLSNPIYVGMVQWHDVLYEGSHTPLVSRALFDHVQEKLHERGHSQTKPAFPYRGLVVCARCGCQITAAVAKQKYIYYRCTGARGGCRPQYVRQDRLGEQLAAVVQGVKMTAEQVEALLNAMHERRGEREAERERGLQQLRRRLETITNRRDAAYEDKLDGKLSEECWLDRDRKWATELFQIKCEMETVAATPQPSMDDVQATLELLQRAPELYLRQNDQERARLLRVLVWNCMWKGGKVVPIYRRPFDLVAKGLASADWYTGQESEPGPFFGAAATLRVAWAFASRTPTASQPSEVGEEVFVLCREDDLSAHPLLHHLTGRARRAGWD